MLWKYCSICVFDKYYLLIFKVELREAKLQIRTDGDDASVEG